MAEGSRKGNRPHDRPARVGSQDDRVQNPGDRVARLGSPDAGGAKPANRVARNHNSVDRSARLRRRRMETEGTK